MEQGLDFNFLWQWVILPLLIFSARVCDVSMGTVRIMLLSRGKKFLAPLIGFFEIFIWLLAFRQIIIHLSNPLCYLAFAGGFAMGTFVGIVIEEKLAIGFQVLRIITRQDATALVDFLKQEGYGITQIDGHGATGKVDVLYTIVQRSEIKQLIEIVESFNPNAFYTIEDVRTISEEGVQFIKAAKINRTVG